MWHRQKSLQTSLLRFENCIREDASHAGEDVLEANGHDAKEADGDAEHDESHAADA